MSLAFVAFINVFKIRYLDYYDKSKEEIKEETKEVKENKKQVNISNDNKVIIRDPKHSEYNFFKGIMKVILFCVKCLSLLVLSLFAGVFILLIAGLFICISHLFINSIFIGCVLVILGLLVINSLALLVLFNFIFNKKINIKLPFILFVVSLVLCGIGGGILSMSFTKLDFEDYLETHLETKTKEYDYNININLDRNNYTFIVDNSLNDKIKITAKYDKNMYNVIFEEEKGAINVYHIYLDNNEFKSVYKIFISGLKKGKLYSINSQMPEIIIETSEENIKKIISDKTKDTLTSLNVDKGQYELFIYGRRTGNYYCNLKDGYYYDCIIVDGDFDNVKEKIGYRNNELIYDHDKYKCDEADSEYKYYYCTEM